MNEIIHIACASDERYFPGLLATLTSIVINTKSTLQIHVIDGGITEESYFFLESTIDKMGHSTLKRYVLDQGIFNDFPDFYFNSKLTYARLLLPNLLTINKVIYVDSDILFFKDISQLWNIPLSEKTVLVASDPKVVKLKNDCPNYQQLNLNPETSYFNAGLMVMDLVRFRSRSLDKLAMSYLVDPSNVCNYWDQSALNVVLYEDFSLLHQSWNVQISGALTKLLESFHDFDINFHFITAFKPWIKYNDSIQNRLFYALMDELGFELSNNRFLDSKNIYRKKMKFSKYLSLFYKIRSLGKKILRQNKKAELDEKIALFWKEQLPIIKFQRKNQKEIQKVELLWRKKINEALQSQSIKI